MTPIETRNKDEPRVDLIRDFATEIYKLEEKLNKLNGERIQNNLKIKIKEI